MSRGTHHAADGRRGRGAPDGGARLRNIVLVAAGATALCAFVLFHYHGTLFAWIGVEALIVLIAVLAERGRYQGGPPLGPEADWEATAEVFEDPATGERLRVHYNRRTGARRYTPDPPPADGPNH